MPIDNIALLAIYGTLNLEPSIIAENWINRGVQYNYIEIHTVSMGHKSAKPLSKGHPVITDRIHGTNLSALEGFHCISKKVNWQEADLYSITLTAVQLPALLEGEFPGLCQLHHAMPPLPHVPQCPLHILYPW